MKKFCCIIGLLCLCVMARGQQSMSAKDSAGLIIDNYLKLMNLDAVKKDSMLYIESVVVNMSTGDTMVMRRWFVDPYNYRTELWHEGSMAYGLLTDGKTVYKEYDGEKKKWEEISAPIYFDKADGYDFHGPFYHWKVLNWSVRYDGIYKWKGADVHKVFVQAPNRYDRNYLFEKNTGLLFLTEELDTYDPDMAVESGTRVQWRGYHEYLPLGRCVFLTAESYMANGELVVESHKYKYLPINLSLFK